MDNDADEGCCCDRARDGHEGWTNEPMGKTRIWSRPVRQVFRKVDDDIDGPVAGWRTEVILSLAAALAALALVAGIRLLFAHLPAGPILLWP